MKQHSSSRSLFSPGSGAILLLSLVFLAARSSVAVSQNSILAKIPVNTAHYLGSYNPPPLSGCPQMESGHITDYSRFSYDSIHNQMLMFGGGHASVPRTDVDVLDLNEGSSLTWGSAYPSTPVSDMTFANFNQATGSWITTGHPLTRHTYDMMTFDKDTGELILLQPVGPQAHCQEKRDWYLYPGKVWIYNPTTKIWRATAGNPDVWGIREMEHLAAEYDPISRQVIIIGRLGIYSFDPASEVAVRRKSFVRPELSLAQNLVYYPPNGKMYYILNNGTIFEVTIERSNLAKSSIVQMKGLVGTFPRGVMPPLSDAGETGWAYDSTNKIIGGGIANSTFYAFDPIARRWTATRMRSDSSSRTIGKLTFHALDYDPVDNVFIFISRAPGDGIDKQNTWAYRYGDGGKSRGKQ
ncbi:exported hypothetical protein [Candidatus Accumulibacter aalborgensis]|uniref:Uncharacterized protein n=1 Tax=Candidatus Accumulibacter aalborgensis TaxID=1860102 RepID=A0A1A8XXC1_9PROT|nr:hypothetical protein [Candidatus Accumulibacter aalborgensis]SBT09371.1 exported hypothetical protein [Candidatus Accumulibacter aalborgensis]